LDQASDRTRAEGLKIEFIAGDAESLPFDNGSFDVVMSTFGVSFAPNQDKAASELLRVCSSGGKIALANWGPGEFIAEIFKLSAKYNPPPKGLKSPLLWGDKESLSSLMGGNCRIISSEIRAVNYRYESSEHFVNHHRQFYGPMIKAFDVAGADQEHSFNQELIDLGARFNVSDDDSMVVPARYLAVVFVKM
jgi:ubiquinone/menaquinone biosynthesis C-methylase UbiE